MSVDSNFTHIGDSQDFYPSVNPISTLASNSNALMGDNTSQNRDNTRDQLPIRGHLGNEDPIDEPDRPRTLLEHLTPERTAAPSCISIPLLAGTFHFRNGMISLLSQFCGIENEKVYLH